MDLILQRIIDELKLQQKKQYELTNYLMINRNSFGNWKAGLNKSYLKYLHAIADYLNVSVEYLKGETDIKQKGPIVDDSDNTLLFALYGKDHDDITPGMLEDVRRFAQFVREEKRKKGDS